MRALNQARPRVCADRLLDRIRMTDGERRAARAYMEQGERVAEILVGAVALARAFAHGVERLFQAVARSKSYS